MFSLLAFIALIDEIAYTGDIYYAHESGSIDFDASPISASDIDG